MLGLCVRHGNTLQMLLIQIDISVAIKSSCSVW